MKPASCRLRLPDFWIVPLLWRREVPKSKVSPLCFLGRLAASKSGSGRCGEEGQLSQSCVRGVGTRDPCGLERLQTGLQQGCLLIRGEEMRFEAAVLILGCFHSSHPWERKVDTRDTRRHQGETAGSATHPSLPAKRSASAQPAKPTPRPASLHKRMPKT